MPWTAINLVDYYLLAHGSYDIASFFRKDGGIYGYVNWLAIFCYVLGIIVEIPFMSTAIYTGPIARMLEGRIFLDSRHGCRFACLLFLREKGRCRSTFSV